MTVEVGFGSDFRENRHCCCLLEEVFGAAGSYAKEGRGVFQGSCSAFDSPGRKGYHNTNSFGTENIETKATDY